MIAEGRHDPLHESAPHPAPRTHHEVLRNEVSADDHTDFAASPPMVTTIGALGLLHALCCGIPLLLLSGVPLAAVASALPTLGVGLALVGGVCFVWYRRRRRTDFARPKECRSRDNRTCDERVGPRPNG